MTLTGFVPTAPEWRAQILRCRFSHPAPTAFPPSDAWLASLDKVRNEQADRFVAAMARQGWELKGRILGTNEPVSVPFTVDERAHDVGDKRETDLWQFEIAARFIRRLMPAEILAVRPKTASRKQLFGVDEFAPIGPSERRPTTPPRRRTLDR